MENICRFPMVQCSWVVGLAILRVVVCWTVLANATCHGQSAPAEAQLEVSLPTTTWLIVRHAERDGDADTLSEAGKQRAELLAQLGQTLNVTAIFSTDFQRTRATAIPLAEALNVPIQTYRQPSFEGLTAGGRDLTGQVVLVVGHSNTVGQLVGSLTAIEPFELEHGEYDKLFIVTVDGESKRYVRLSFGSPSQSSKPVPADRIEPQVVRPLKSGVESNR